MITLFVSSMFFMTAERPQIHASDVVFMYPAGDTTQYDAYAGTVVGWGGRPRKTQAIESFQQRVAEANKRGMRYCASVDFLVDFSGFIDFRPETFMDAVCINLDGKPLRVPWLWDHEYKGNPAYWFCTNNPDYQAYLQDQAKRACTAPIDGLHIDDYSGSSACSAYNGGCFCHYCMEGFRNHLQAQFSDKQLSEMGIDQIDEFDYREFLKEKGVTAEQFKRKSLSCPLGDLFQDFQNRRMKQIVGDIFEYAEGLIGKDLVRSVNSSASSPRTLVVAPEIDYFCGEIPHSASTAQVPTAPIFVFKMVEALQLRQTATASGQDWAWIKANDKPGLVRTWIAQTYAFGSVFMVPHRQWCYTQELGTHWWNGKDEDFAYIYRFVRENSSLLDGYISLANIAVVYSNSNFNEIRDVILKLSDANIPFAIVVAGDDSLPYRLRKEILTQYDYLVVGSNPEKDGQEKVVKEAQAQIVSWKEIDALPKAITDQIVVNGSDNVRVSLKYNPDAHRSTVVCHLLNQNYIPENDDICPVDVNISIDSKLLRKFGFAPKSATIYTPTVESYSIPIKSGNDRITLEIEGLKLWAIVELNP